MIYIWQLHDVAGDNNNNSFNIHVTGVRNFYL